MFREILKKIFIKIIVPFIILDLRIIKNKKIIYPPFNSFGDCFEFYLKNYKKFRIQKKGILTFSNIDFKITNFLFHKNKIQKSFFFVGSIPTYEIFNHLNKKKIFKPYFNLKNKPNDHLIWKNNDFYKKILHEKIYEKENQLSKKVKNLSKLKYVTFFFKHYNKNVNDLNFSASRQTSNIGKIIKLINFISKNFRVVILGIDSDLGLKILKSKVRKSKKILFLNDLSKNYSVEDQLYCFSKSVGFVGNGSSMVPLNWLLKKKYSCLIVIMKKMIQDFILKIQRYY